MNEQINEELSLLLYNNWIIKDERNEDYYKIKNKQGKIRDYLMKNLGSNLIITDRFIKLEKLPTNPSASFGIKEFTSVLEYCLLLVSLMFLEDKTRGDKFIFSDFIEYIKNTMITLELDHVPDWNLMNDRKALSNVMKLLLEESIIKLKNDDKRSFIESKEADALYEVSGISNYLMRMFSSEIFSISEPEEFLKSEFLSQDEERGDFRRFKVFRNLLYTPFVSSIDLTEAEKDYIKKNRFYIKNEIENKLDFDTEITNNSFLIYDNINLNEKDNFPNNKKICEIALMVNNEIYNKIKNKEIKLNENETAMITVNHLESIIERIRINKKPYLTKEFLNLNKGKFFDIVTSYLEKYNFIKILNTNVIIMPSVGKMIGITKEIEKENEQMNIFGGENSEL